MQKLNACRWPPSTISLGRLFFSSNGFGMLIKSFISVIQFLFILNLVFREDCQAYRIPVRKDHCRKIDHATISSVVLFSIMVEDGVIDQPTCSALDSHLKVGGLGHTVFFRELPPKNVVESLINSLLASANDVSPIVEYWWRDEWLNLELHRDLDERLASQNGPVRYPDNAHVLYLSVGKEAIGPTILLRDCRKSENKGLFDEISIVPAVAGRLLRFPGNMMHAVPRPPLAYLDPAEGGTNVELWTRRRPTDENDPECTIFRRSVLLFNTWTDAPSTETSETSSTSASTADVIEGSLDIQKIKEESWRCTPREKWVNAFSTSSHDSIVTGSSSSSSSSRSSLESEPNIRLKIGLLGDVRRRGRTDRYMSVYAPQSIKQALMQQIPVSFPLSHTP